MKLVISIFLFVLILTTTNFVDAQKCETYQRDDGKIMCLSESTAQKLMDRGWEITKLIIDSLENNDDNYLVIFNKTTPFWLNENNELMVGEQRSNFDVHIFLDKQKYAMNDKVFIAIVAPMINLDSNLIESFDHYNEDIVTTIETRESSLKNYKFVETGIDTSIFTSDVQLIDYRDAREKEIKFTDDALVVTPEDGITIRLTILEGFTNVGSALVKGTFFPS